MSSSGTHSTSGVTSTIGGCSSKEQSGGTSKEENAEPVFLPIGTDVSAKYKGAFCEAKIKSVNKCIKCRVTVKSSGSSSGQNILVTDDCIKGQLKVGATVEVLRAGHHSDRGQERDHRGQEKSGHSDRGQEKSGHSDRGQEKSGHSDRGQERDDRGQEGIITKIIDASQYTVVFDDGDETTLRRTSLCLKSGKHYSESESLDHLPLTNPEHFGNPVGRSGQRSRRRRRPERVRGVMSSIPSDEEGDEEDASVDENGTIDSDLLMDDDDSNITQQSSISRSKDSSTRCRDSSMTRWKDTGSKDCKDKDPEDRSGDTHLGKVFIVEYNLEKRGNKAKDFWFPALCVHPASQETLSLMSIIQANLIKIDPETQVLVRSFKDNKFHALEKSKILPFDKEIHSLSKLNDTNSSAALRNAIEKTLHWLERSELPSQWNFDILLQGFVAHSNQSAKVASEKVASEKVTSEKVASGSRRGGEKAQAREEEESEGDSELGSTANEEEECDRKYHSLEEDEQPSEEKDRFVAQLYKFMDERGTPINKSPTVHGKDVDLYKLYCLVNKMGGYNRITNKNEWKRVYEKCGLSSVHTSDRSGHASDRSGHASDRSGESESLKNVYKKFLLNFTDFYRKLGYSSAFVNSSIASRTNTRPARNERSWRSSASVSITPGGPSESREKASEGKDSKMAPEEKGSKVVPEEKVSKPGRRKKSISVDASEMTVKDESGPPSNDPSSVTTENGDEENSGRVGTSGRRGSMKKRRGGRRGGRSEAASTPPGVEEEDSRTGEESENGPGPDDETDLNVPHIADSEEIRIGDKLRVRYTKGTGNDIFEVKVMKARVSKTDAGKEEYYVHYSGWNSRYDEWIKRHRIVEVVREKSPKKRVGGGSGQPVSSTVSGGPSTTLPPGVGGGNSSQGSTSGSMKGISKTKGGPPSESASSGSSPNPSQETVPVIPEIVKETPKGKKGSTVPDGTAAKGALKATPSGKKGHWKHRQQIRSPVHESVDENIPILPVTEGKQSKSIKSEPVEDAVEIKGTELISKTESSIGKSTESPPGTRRISMDTSVTKSTDPPSGTRRISIDTNDASEEPTSRSRYADAECSKRGTKRGSSKDTEKGTTIAKKGVSGEQVGKKGVSGEQAGKKGVSGEQVGKKGVSGEQVGKKRESSPEPPVRSSKKSRGKREEDETESKVDQSRTESKSDPNVSKPPSKEEEGKVGKKRKQTSEEETIPESGDSKKKKKSKEAPKIEIPAKEVSSVSPSASSRSCKKGAKRKEEESDVNAEIARLFNEPKDGAKSDVDANIEPKDQSDDLLLCKEDIPMSPVAAPSGDQPPEDKDTPRTSAPKNAEGGQHQFTPPTTPESLRSGTLSSLTPPHENVATGQKANQETESCEKNQSIKNCGHRSTQQNESDDSRERSDEKESKGKNQITSPKRKRRGGRTRTASQSESVHRTASQSESVHRTASQGESVHEPGQKESVHRISGHKSTGYKTRGASGRKKMKDASSMIENDRYSPLHSDVQMSPSLSSLGTMIPNAFLTSMKPVSKYNFVEPIDESVDPDERIKILQERLSRLRSTYLGIKSDLASLEKRRKKNKKRSKNNTSNNSPNATSANHGSCSRDEITKDVSAKDVTSKAS